MFFFAADIVLISTVRFIFPFAGFIKYRRTIRHSGYTSRTTSFNSADVENDLHCESEVPFGVCTALYI